MGFQDHEQDWRWLVTFGFGGVFWASVPWVGIHSPCCFMCSGPTCGVGD